MFNKIQNIAVDIAKEAGKVLFREYQIFDRANVSLKSGHDILTKADLLSEEIILKRIGQNFPNYDVVSEERGEIKNSSKFCWYVDPLDGTTNFSMHNPLWSISLALAKDNEIIFGLVYAPVLDELYLANLGKGASLNGRSISISSVNLKKVLHTYCHGNGLANIKQAVKYYSHQKLNELDCRQMGSAAIELAYVAKGRVESFVAPGANDWDVAAGVLLVREAGGKVTDFKGKPWRLGSGDIIASNGKVHKQILGVI
ncbi:MAG: inositol monophosphatase [Patescibacteria group bacterium]|nr:inositol monophosphatase [Patescibacteria group bacterium]